MYYANLRLDKMETTRCIICDSYEYEAKLYAVRSGELVKCKMCSLVYVNPRCTDSIMAIHNNTTPTELYDSKKFNYDGRLEEFIMFLNIINANKIKKGRILDIGCYEGYFLAQAKNNGWECYGVEPNVGGSKYATEKLGLNVKQCVLEEAEYRDRYFDVITIFAAIEHVPDPYALLKEAKRILKTDGILLVSVPVIPFYLPLIKNKWRMFIGDHYYFFTDLSMGKLLKKAGFDLLKSEYIQKSVDLDTVSARLADDWQPNNLGSIGKTIRNIVLKLGIEKIRFKINLFDTKYYMAKIHS